MPQSRASVSATVRSGTDVCAMPEPEDRFRFVSRPRPAGVVDQGSHPADISDPVAVSPAPHRRAWRRGRLAGMRDPERGRSRPAAMELAESSW
jgi:hypothetical protein